MEKMASPIEAVNTRANRRILAIQASLFIIASLALFSTGSTEAAEELSLRKGISFVEDTDGGFPIIANRFNDMTIEPGKTTLIFFGASADLNTNRQAKRIVSLYKRFKDKPVKFVIVDVDRPANAQMKTIIKSHYRGYVPAQVILGQDGKEFWHANGEIQEKDIASRLEKLLD